jgi:hypothetical protein
LLDGRDLSLIDYYESAMRDAAAQQAFERAASYRDTWEQLTLLTDQLSLLQVMQHELWFVYPTSVATATRQPTTKRWIAIAGGIVAAVLPEPRSLAAAQLCLERLASIWQTCRSVAPDNYDQARLVAAWFRQHPDERERVLAPDQAEAICRDRLAITAREPHPSRTGGRCSIA